MLAQALYEIVTLIRSRLCHQKLCFQYSGISITWTCLEQDKRPHFRGVRISEGKISLVECDEVISGTFKNVCVIELSTFPGCPQGGVAL